MHTHDPSEIERGKGTQLYRAEGDELKRTSGNGRDHTPHHTSRRGGIRN